MSYSREQLEQYIQQMTQRKAEEVHPWMKDQCQKGIDLAKAELAKLEEK